LPSDHLRDRSRPECLKPTHNGIVLIVIGDDTCARNDLLRGDIKYAAAGIQYVDIGQWIKDVSLQASAQNILNVASEYWIKEERY